LKEKFNGKSNFLKNNELYSVKNQNDSLDNLEENFQNK
jgi:hypothetical protein